MSLKLPSKNIHELMRLELRLQKILDRYEGTRARDLDMAAAALDVEYAYLVTRDGEVDIAPIAF